MLGVGAMIKGPIILVVAGLTLGALCLWDRKAGWLKRLHAGWGVLIALAIAVPWYVAIGMVSDGYFFTRSIGVNFLNKVHVGQQAHGGPPGYHLLSFPLMFWPTALFAAFAAPSAWRDRAKPEVRFLLCWIIPSWIAFELAATKLPHYVLPTYPALAMLAGAALFSAEPGKPGLWLKLAGGVFAALWLAASAVLAALGPWGLYEFEGRVDALAVGLGVAGFALSAAALYFLLRRSHALAVGAALAAAAFVWSGLYGALIRADQFWMSPRIVAAADVARPCPGDRTLISNPFHEPSLVFLNGYADTKLVRDGALVADGLAAHRACGLALVGQAQQAAFLARAAELGLSPRVAGQVAGRNYSDGEDLTLTFYAAGGQPPGHEQP
jgi:4-amino-4-deoxy-L-arabinose transferase-like glycosyltransferase